MKKIAVLALLILTMACSSEKKKKTDAKTNTTSEATIVTDFLNDISTLKNIEKGNPIEIFEELAQNEASKKSILTKETISEILKTAKNFKNTVVIVENHTLVKIKNLEDCKESGSWGTCMPFAEGFIKKGTLLHKEDYLNNIIGLSDSKTRTAYFFN